MARLFARVTTDESGRMVIRLPDKEFERLTVTARGDGLVPKRVFLRGRGDRRFPFVHAGDGTGHLDRWHRPGQAGSADRWRDRQAT